MNLLEGLIPGEEAPKQADANFLEKLFVFSLMWSVGALLELDDRKKVQYCALCLTSHVYFYHVCGKISLLKCDQIEVVS